LKIRVALPNRVLSVWTLTTRPCMQLRSAILRKVQLVSDISEAVRMFSFLYAGQLIIEYKYNLFKVKSIVNDILLN
jgi:hypothetical protein